MMTKYLQNFFNNIRNTINSKYEETIKNITIKDSNETNFITNNNNEEFTKTKIVNTMIEPYNILKNNLLKKSTKEIIILIFKVIAICLMISLVIYFIYQFAISQNKTSITKPTLIPIASTPIASTPIDDLTPIASTPIDDLTPIFIEPTIKFIENGIRKTDNQVQKISNKSFSISCWYKMQINTNIKYEYKGISIFYINNNENLTPNQSINTPDARYHENNDQSDYWLRFCFWPTYTTEFLTFTNAKLKKNIDDLPTIEARKYRKNNIYSNKGNIEEIDKKFYLQNNEYYLYTLTYDNNTNICKIYMDYNMVELNVKQEVPYDKTYLHINKILWEDIFLINNFYYYDSVLSIKNIKYLIKNTNPTYTSY